MLELSSASLNYLWYQYFIETIISNYFGDYDILTHFHLIMITVNAISDTVTMSFGFTTKMLTNQNCKIYYTDSLIILMCDTIIITY